MNYKDILDVDLKRIEFIKKECEAFLKDEQTAGELADHMREKNMTVSPMELSYAVQDIFDSKAFSNELVQKSGDLLWAFDPFFGEDARIPKTSADHPLLIYKKENDAMRAHLDEGRALLKAPFDQQKWRDYADVLKEFKVHFVRKQNQLYPRLENKDFNFPSRVLWIYDDEVRSGLNVLVKAVEEGSEKGIHSAFRVLDEHARNVMRSEERVIFPTAFRLLRLDEFLRMEFGDDEVGFAFIEPPNYNKAEVAMMASLEKLMIQHDGRELSGENVLNLRRGKLTLEQLNAMLSHLPFDVTFVDDEELVRYYNDIPERIFPRSPGVIGRDVKNCHPQVSLRSVIEIISKFRSGEEDKAEFWYQKGGRFIYVTYIAVRDVRREFLGVLEVAIDLTVLRTLEGEQHLAVWRRD